MEELVIANSYLYGVGLEEVEHQCLVLCQLEATGGCVMCGDDKEAVPCLHPGLEVREFDSVWLLGVGSPELALYHLLQATSTQNQCTYLV